MSAYSLLRRLCRRVPPEDGGVAVDSAEARARLEDSLALFAAGNGDMEPLRVLAQSNREWFTETLLAFIMSLRGDGRDRLCELALKVLLVEDWCEVALGKNSKVRNKAYACIETVAHYEPVHRVAKEALLRGLRDPDLEIRFLSARALAHCGNPESAARVLDVAAVQTAENRMVLAQDLFPFALSLCSVAIPRALGSSQVEIVLGILEILEAWECALSLEDLSDVAKHSNIEVRRKTMLLLAKMPSSWQNRNVLLAGLADSDVHVSAAAAQTAGRMKVRSAIPALTLCLRRGDKDLERAAADALREMQAKEILEEFFGSEAQEAVLRNGEI